MPSIVERVKSGTQRFLGAFKTADPLNQESEIRPDELAEAPDYDPSESEKAAVDYVLAFQRRSANARRGIERGWVLSLAMVEGRQWLGWDDQLHRTINLLDDEEQDKYITDNLLDPLLGKWSALVTMTRPDGNVSPDTTAEKDRLAAAEGRVILGDVDREHATQLQRLEQAAWIGTVGVCFTKHYWDPFAWADIPVYGPDGQQTGKTQAQVGAYCRSILPPWEVYLDADCKRFDEVRRYVHRCVRPMSWVMERFPKTWKNVKAEAGDATADFVSCHLSGGGGHSPAWSGGGDEDHRGVVVDEYIELPNPQYPKGRYLIVAGGALMHRGKYPYKWRGTRRNRLPLTRAVYREATGHPYGRGLIEQAVPLQVAYNRLLTTILKRAEFHAKPTLQVPTGSKIGADAFEVEEDGPIRKVYVDLVEGGYLQWMPPDPTSADVYRLREIIWGDIQHAFGIHEVQMGSTPPGVTAGITVELLQQGDRTQLAPVIMQLEQAAVDEGQWAIVLHGQYLSPYLPRLMGLDQSGNPEQARLQAMSFVALTGGGSCSVIVTPGSAMPKSPAGQNQEVMEMYLNGLFGPVGSPDAAMMAVTLMALSKSSQVQDHLKTLQAKQAEEQQAALAVQQAQVNAPVEIAAQREAAQTERVRMQAEGALLRDRAAADDKASLSVLQSALKLKEMQQQQAAQLEAARENRFGTAKQGPAMFKKKGQK